MRPSRFEITYLCLAGIFIAALVACNLIFQKFFMWTPLAGMTFLPEGLSEFTFEISVGILPYPVTFLVTDIVSEIYGKKRADMVVKAGMVASLFVLAVVVLADTVPATSWSPVDEATFHRVFGLFGPAIFASMTAYLVAQFVDIRLFHFWKRLTRGRHLWLRNNGSTILSQLVDTSLVLVILCVAGVIEWERFAGLFGSGFLFKVLIALLDTPFFYALVGLFKRLFPEEIEELRRLDPSAA